MIYGASIIAGCMLLGALIGDIIGKLMGINSNVGGVGFAMLFLILFTDLKIIRNRITETISYGLKFWQAMYIPIVTAMAASQNVVQAIASGFMAILAGLMSVIICFILLPILNHTFSSHEIR